MSLVQRAGKYKLFSLGSSFLKKKKKNFLFCIGVAQLVKNPPANAGDLGSLPGLGRSAGEGNGYPVQYSDWRIPWTEELAGYSPWGHKEADMTKPLSLSFSLSLSHTHTHMPT